MRHSRRLSIFNQQLAVSMELAGHDDIAIVGMGVAGLSLFIQLIKEAEKAGIKLSIRLIEKNPVAGPGRPWALNQNYGLRSNDSIANLTIDIDKPDDFEKWFKYEFRIRHPEVAAIYAKEIAKDPDFLPRVIFGLYLRDRLIDTINEARALGHKVTLEENTEVIDAKKLADGRWHYTAEDGRKFESGYLGLKLGHLPSGELHELRENLKDEKNVISPFKNEFHQVDWQAQSADQKVFCIGTGLTMLDINIKLRNAGYPGEIVAISPSAHLPRLKDPLPAELKNPPQQPYQPKYLTEEALRAIIKIKQKLPLADVLELYAMEISHAMQMPLTKEDILHIARKTGEKPINTLYKEFESILAGKSREWLRVLRVTHFIILPLLQFMSPEDKNEYFKVYFPLYLKWVAGIPRYNGELLLSYLEDADLTLQKGTAADIKKEGEHFVFITKEGETLIGDYVIVAGGIGKNPLRVPLLRAMIGKGLCCQDPIAGITVDPVDFRVKAKNGFHDNCYAFGPLIFGCDFATLVAKRVVSCGKIVAQEIINSIASKAKLCEQAKQMQKHASVTSASQAQNLNSAASTGQVDLNEGSQGFRAHL